MEDRELPEDTLNLFDNRVQAEENGITNVKQLKELLTKAIIETKKIREVTAREIADVIIDDNKTFEEAKNIVYGQQEQDKDDRFPSRDPREH